MKLENTQDLIGEYSNELCPDCGHKLFENKIGDKWCEECGWANTEDFMKYLREDIKLSDDPEFMQILGKNTGIK